MIWLMQASKSNPIESVIARSRELVRSGEHKQAYKLCRKAASTGASHPDFYLIYGVSAHGCGKSSEAIKLLRNSVHLWPNSKGSLFNLGHILLSCGHPQDAIEILLRLCADDPGYPGTQANLAVAYYSTGQLELAADACQMAISPAPDNPETAELYNLLGTIYRDRESNELSETAFKKALDLNPGYADALANLSLMLEESAQIEAASMTGREGLNRFPNDPRFPLVLAKCERRQGQATQALARLSGIELDRQMPAFQAQAYYEMGRLWDRENAAGKAFDCFSKANAIIALAVPASIKKAFYPKILKATSRFYDNGGLASPKTKVHDGAITPCFLIGFPRSGTTLLELTLAGHTDVAVMEEPPLIQELYTDMTGANVAYPMILNQLDDRRIASLRKKYFERASDYADMADKRVLINKHPLDTIFLPVIRTVFPDAKILFSARHPVDVCLSCWMQEFQLNAGNINFLSLQSAADFYAACMDLWMLFKADAGMDHLIVSYEDIVDNHEETAKKAIQFLDLEWSPSVLNHAGTAKSLPRVNTASYHQVTEPIYARSKNRWEKYRPFLAPILPKLRPYVEHFGYKM